MNSKQTNSDSKAMVTVFDDLETAKVVVEALHSNDFSLDKIELVTHDVSKEAPELKTPKVHDTTANSMVNSAAKWGGIGAVTGGIGAATGGIGAATGVLAAVFAPFPGLALGMIFMGGLSGAIAGSIAGLQHAIEDDAVDLPTLDEYKQLVSNGHSLVVVLGSHEEVMRAEEIVKGMLHVRSHIHVVHGHEYHEHPARKSEE